MQGVIKSYDPGTGDGVVVRVNLCVPDCTEVEVIEHA